MFCHRRNLRAQVNELTQRMNKMADVVADLKAAVASVASAVTAASAALADLAAKVAAGQTINPQDIEDQATALNQAAAALNQAVATNDPPAPAPAPTPTPTP